VVTKEIKVWQNFVPVAEVGQGKAKDYGKPVKVTVRSDGKAVITEWDGDQWLVSKTGSYAPLDKHAEPRQGFRKPGQAAPAAPVKTYEEETGDEHYYFGRGYVQLTWWSNYAAAGLMLGRGLDLLLDPDLANDRKTAYEILSTGMRKGMAFANGKKFSQYFHDDVTDYMGARAMVNSDGAKEVAGYAEAFERILFEARLAELVQKQ